MERLNHLLNLMDHTMHISNPLIDIFQITREAWVPLANVSINITRHFDAGHILRNLIIEIADVLVD